MVSKRVSHFVAKHSELIQAWVAIGRAHAVAGERLSSSVVYPSPSSDRVVKEVDQSIFVVAAQEDNVILRRVHQVDEFIYNEA